MYVPPIIYVELYMYITNKSLVISYRNKNYYSYFVLKILIKYIKHKNL